MADLRTIALLIDADNTPPQKMPAVLEELSALGDIPIRRAGSYLRERTREEDSAFSVKQYGYNKLVNFIKSFPKLYKVRETRLNGPTIYTYKCCHLPLRLQ